MTTQQNAAKQLFIDKYLPIDGEMFWARLHRAGQLVFVPAGKRRAYWRLAR